MSARETKGPAGKPDGALFRASPRVLPRATAKDRAEPQAREPAENPADGLRRSPTRAPTRSRADWLTHSPGHSSGGSPDDLLADPPHPPHRFNDDALAGDGASASDNGLAQRSGNAKRGRRHVQASSPQSSSQPLFGAFVQKSGRGDSARGAMPDDADDTLKAATAKAAATTAKTARTAAKAAATVATDDGPASLHAIGPAQWPDDAIEVGAVVDAYGLKGQVKVVAHAAGQGAGQRDSALLSATRWWLRKGRECWSVAGVSAKVHGDSIVAQLGGVADRDAALRLRGCGVHVRRSAFPALADDEFYWVDLLGLDVLNEAGVALGQVVGMIDNGAHSVLRVAYLATAAPMSTDKRAQPGGQPVTGERLIPFVGVYVKTVDLAARRIVVAWETDY